MNRAFRSGPVQQGWHYQDEKTGARLGPADDTELNKLIDDGRLLRSTLVWNPAMPDWAKAGTTDLASRFNAPPPLPATMISRWALFTLSLLPLWGLVIQAAISAQFPNPQAAFASPTWILFYIAGNGLFGWLDELGLEKAGLQVKGATIVSALLTPAYIYISCRTYKLHAERAAWFAYSPLIIWILSVALAIVEAPHAID